VKGVYHSSQHSEYIEHLHNEMNVPFNVTGHSGDKTFQARDCTGTYNQNSQHGKIYAKDQPHSTDYRP